MSSAELEKLLGEPDDDKDSTVPGISYISYRSRGFEIRVSKDLGAEEITCELHLVPTRVRSPGPRGRSFGGKTDRGVGLGASSADVIQTYGKPSWMNSGGTCLKYQKLGATFSFYDDKLWSMSFMHPRIDTLRGVEP